MKVFVTKDQLELLILQYFSERIVMTPKKKTSNSTTLKMERKRIINSSNGGDAKVHVAGGTQFDYQIEDLWVFLSCS